MMNGVGLPVPPIEIFETSLTGNQPYKNMIQNKIKWTTADDTTNTKQYRLDDSIDGVVLQQQRIRVFKVTYDVQLN